MRLAVWVALAAGRAAAAETFTFCAADEDASPWAAAIGAWAWGAGDAVTGGGCRAATDDWPHLAHAEMAPE